MLKFDTISRAEALRYILRGLQMRRAEIDMHVRVLREQLDPELMERRAELDAIPAPPVLKRRFSAAARKRMAAAQRARYARERA